MIASNLSKARGRQVFLIVVLFLSALQTGCIIGRQHPAATQPATAIDPKTAQPAYWLDQSAVAVITSKNFDRLWNACRDAAQADGFAIDRTDYRDGLLTTLPLVSRQVYEFWRSDIATHRDLTQSTLGTMRRTIRYTIRRLEDGTFEATPKILVERHSMIERRITSVDQYQAVFSIQTMDVARETEKVGTNVQPEYWYSVGRDLALERKLADSIRRRLQQTS
jgi:hypothetical protein